MDVSVCIVNWNTCDLLYNCLDSIKKITQDLNYEIIVVDNNSADGSVQMVSANFLEYRLITSKKNLGFAKGSNLAAKEALGKYILYLNPDTELVTNALFGMYAFLEEHVEYGAVGCKLLNSDSSIQYTCASTFPSPKNELSSLLFLDRLFPKSKFFSARELNHWNHEDSRRVDCLSGACIMLPKVLVEHLGGFDENFFMYGEDLDLCYRLRKEGQQLYYLATETIFHYEGAGSKKKGKNFAPLLQRKANYYFIQKNFSLGRAINYRCAVAIGSMTRIIGALILSPLLLLRKPSEKEKLIHFFGKHTDLFLWSIGLRNISI